jgi:hypothetical protein
MFPETFVYELQSNFLQMFEIQLELNSGVNVPILHDDNELIQIINPKPKTF